MQSLGKYNQNGILLIVKDNSDLIDYTLRIKSEKIYFNNSNVLNGTIERKKDERFHLFDSFDEILSRVNSGKDTILFYDPIGQDIDTIISLSAVGYSIVVALKNFSRVDEIYNWMSKESPDYTIEEIRQLFPVCILA